MSGRMAIKGLPVTAAFWTILTIAKHCPKIESYFGNKELFLPQVMVLNMLKWAQTW
jgi:hypothetical protein